MAGINFMALADGMMLGDKLNKEDDTYWRKQAQEDRKAQYDERDQAYKEKVQGYGLNTFEDQQQNKEAARLSAQAFDGYVQAAKAQGIPLSQVILNAQPYSLPNATPEMMARFNEKLNNAIDINVVAPLRLSRDFETADKLQRSLGLQPNAPENAMLAFGDPEKAHAFISSRLPNVAKDANNNYLISGVPFTQAEAMNIVTSTPAAAAAAVAAREREVRSGTKIETMQLDYGKRQSELDGRRAALQAVNNGYGRASLPEAYRGFYDEITTEKAGAVGATAPAANPNSVDAMTSQPAMPVTPGVSPTGNHSDWRTAPAVAAAPTAAAPAPAPAEKDMQWKGMLEKANILQSEVTGLETQKKDIQKDLQSMTSLEGRKHFDPATVDNARKKLAELNSILSLKSTELNSVHSAVRSAPVARPGYVNILNEKYR